jgi:hypothetical protein
MRLPARRDMVAMMIIPCPACGGSGQASCCEGAVGGADEITNTPRGSQRNPLLGASGFRRG